MDLRKQSDLFQEPQEKIDLSDNLNRYNHRTSSIFRYEKNISCIHVKMNLTYRKHADIITVRKREMSLMPKVYFKKSISQKQKAYDDPSINEIVFSR